MKKIILAAILLTPAIAMSENGFYLDIGAGYVIDQSNVDVYSVEQSSSGKYFLQKTGDDYYKTSSPSAYGALGYVRGDLRFEIAHSSGWVDGWPFNDEKEHHRTELRIVKRFRPSKWFR